MLRKLSVPVCSLALLAGLLGAAPAEAATPSRITSVRAVPGPGVGQVTISWHTAGRSTTRFEVETGLTSFSKTSASLPRAGRNRHVFSVAGNRRSVTLTAAQVRAAGAAPETANHLYFRLYAKNGSATRAYPYLRAVLPRPVPPKARGTSLRVATFNVRTARATSDARSWLRRAPDVARQIKSTQPGIVAIQELGPGRADGRLGTTKGTPRQTTSLLTALRKVGASRYRLTRTTSYVPPGRKHSTQGARILYDSSRYQLLSPCRDTTGKHRYSSTCRIELPLLAGDSESRRRSAANARFRDRRTGKRFWVASVHLDDRHSGNLPRERSLEALRGRQIATVVNRINAVNRHHEPVVIAGDVNSWQNNKGGNVPHDRLVGRGYYDMASAQVRVRAQYSTINHFAKTQQPGAQGFGSRIDVIMVKGARGARRYDNVTRVTDSSRPSDHNEVVSDLVL